MWKGRWKSFHQDLSPANWSFLLEIDFFLFIEIRYLGRLVLSDEVTFLFHQNELNNNNLNWFHCKMVKTFTNIWKLQIKKYNYRSYSLKNWLTKWEKIIFKLQTFLNFFPKLCAKKNNVQMFEENFLKATNLFIK